MVFGQRMGKNKESVLNTRINYTLLKSLVKVNKGSLQKGLQKNKITYNQEVEISRRNFLRLAGLGVCGTGVRYITNELPLRPLLTPIPERVNPSPESVATILYPDLENPPQENMTAYIANLEEQLAHKFQVIGIFNTWHTNPVNREVLAWITEELGKIPLISLGPQEKNDPNRKFIFDDIESNSDYLEVLTKIGDEISTQPKEIPIIIRYMYEPHHWYPYGRNYQGLENPDYPAKFRRHYQEFFRYLWERGFTNVLSCFSVTAGEEFEDLYPGEEYVNVTGLDGYHLYEPDLLSRFFWIPGNTHFLEIFGRSIIKMKNLAPNQPCWITETNGKRPDYLRQAFSQAPYFGISGMGLFNYNKKYTGLDFEDDWRVEKNERSIEALRSSLSDPAYIKSQSQALTTF